MELLQLNGEGIQIGDIGADELAQMAGKPALSVILADGRVLVLVGMTRDECRQCLPAFLAPVRLTVSAKDERLPDCRQRAEDGPLQGTWFLDVLDAEGDILATLEVNKSGVAYLRRVLRFRREIEPTVAELRGLAEARLTPNVGVDSQTRYSGAVESND